MVQKKSSHSSLVHLFFLLVLLMETSQSTFQSRNNFPTSTSRPKLYLLSDLHLDPFYGTSSAYGPCTSPSSAPRFSTQQCDTSYALLNSALDDLFDQAREDSDTILIITGDFVRHGISSFSEETALQVISNISTYIAEAIAKRSSQLSLIDEGLEHVDADGKKGNFHVVPFPNLALSIGNEDNWKDYYFNSSNAGKHVALNLLVGAFSKVGLINAQDVAMLSICGYNAQVIPNSNLVIVSLNTILYSPNHNPSPVDLADPCSQFAWLRSQLVQARGEGRKLFIIGHIIPLSSKWAPSYLVTFQKMVLEFADVIAAMWFGHTHFFEFFLESSDPASPLTVDVPAINSRDGNNPSYLRVSFADQPSLNTSIANSTWTIQEIHMRSINISGDVATWVNGPSLPSDFGDWIAPPLLSSNVYQFLTRLLSESTTSGSHWKLFEEMYSGGVVNNPLGEKDKTELLCHMISPTDAQYETCKGANKKINNNNNKG